MIPHCASALAAWLSLQRMQGLFRVSQSKIILYQVRKPFLPLQCEMTTQDEVIGKVHEGFYAALFYHSKESDGKKFNVATHALFRCICEKLAEEVGDKKSLYVTGHSLGETL